MSYIMSGGNGHASTQYFKFSKCPDTGQIFLDAFGSKVVTPGWPHTRPMAGQKGETADFVTKFAAIRWTRRDVQQDFGAVQKVQPQQQQMGGGGGGGSAEVQRLMELRNQGVLSEDEFTAAKKKALGI